MTIKELNERIEKMRTVYPFSDNARITIDEDARTRLKARVRIMERDIDKGIMITLDSWDESGVAKYGNV